jgi:subtilisin family serine protease
VGARVTQRAFVEAGADRETGHGTAVAALLVGNADTYSGVIPGAQVVVADVYGSSGTGGAAETIAEALAWLDQQNVDVINISLAGPANRTVEAVVRAVTARGRVIVAAVGNAGPTQPVAFPAAYDGVLGVTAIDIEKRVYIAANRGPQVDVAALGVNVVAAMDDGTYAPVSGTSFAAPIVAASAAVTVQRARNPRAGIDTLLARAFDLGAPGRDPVYGVGAIALP